LLSHIELSLMDFHKLKIHIKFNLEVLLVQLSSIDEHLVFDLFKLVSNVILHQKVLVIVVVNNPLRLLLFLQSFIFPLEHLALH